LGKVYFSFRDKEVDTIKFETIEKQLVELNTADSSRLLSINGIGPYFAGKIVNYREKLGGYYKIEQLKDIKGMDSLKFVSIRNQMQLDTTLVKKIDLNSISVNDLKSHPYVSFRLAESIIKYRNFKKGKVNLNELLENHVITNNDFERLSPYFCEEIP
jgi:competence protein ComEA